MRLVTVKGGESPITDAEEELIERILDSAAGVDRSSIDAWCRVGNGGGESLAFAARWYQTLAQCSEIERRAAYAISCLTDEERSCVRRLLERNQQAYFSGFHESAHLIRALELAELHGTAHP